MEIAAGDIDRAEFIIGHGDPFWIARLVETTAYGEAGVGAGGADEFDDDLVGEDRSLQCQPSLGTAAAIVRAFGSVRSVSGRGRSPSVRGSPRHG